MNKRTEWKAGRDLTEAQQDMVKLRYKFRFTKENVPLWATEPRPDGTRYMPQFESDQEWLENSHFRVYIHNQHLLSGACNSMSNPTWPDGMNESLQSIGKEEPIYES